MTGVLRIVSGGQTGVDRAALDVALGLGFPCGGWCPKARKAEDGAIDEQYPLKETPKRDYAQRTEWNVRDSDATLILTIGELSGGTKLTAELAERYGRPLLIVDLDGPPAMTAVVEWITENAPQTLNVAGPRESTVPGIYEAAYAYLKSLGSHLLMDVD